MTVHYQCSQCPTHCPADFICSTLFGVSNIIQEHTAHEEQNWDLKTWELTAEPPCNHCCHPLVWNRTFARCDTEYIHLIRFRIVQSMCVLFSWFLTNCLQCSPQTPFPISFVTLVPWGGIKSDFYCTWLCIYEPSTIGFQYSNVLNWVLDPCC